VYGEHNDGRVLRIWGHVFSELLLLDDGMDESLTPPLHPSHRQDGVLPVVGRRSSFRFVVLLHDLHVHSPATFTHITLKDFIL
jgi:hypothetical protein